MKLPQVPVLRGQRRGEALSPPAEPGARQVVSHALLSTWRIWRLVIVGVNYSPFLYLPEFPWHFKKQSRGCLIPTLYPETNIILYVTLVTENEIFKKLKYKIKKKKSFHS